MPADPPDDLLDTARAVLAGGDHAALASIDGAGWPYVSLVLVAPDDDGAPLLLLSDLAEHTRNIIRDPRASLLFDGTAGLVAPLAGPRLTLLGRMARCPAPAARARYLARHPAAAGWAGLRDFQLYRLVPIRAHLVAGFGRIAWIEAAALFSAGN
jgi:hypothetical protein